MEGDVGGGSPPGWVSHPACRTHHCPPHTDSVSLAWPPSYSYGWGVGVVQVQRAEPTGSLTQHTQPGQLCMREEEDQEVVSSPAQSVCVRPAVMLGGQEGVVSCKQKG